MKGLKDDSFTAFFSKRTLYVCITISILFTVASKYRCTEVRSVPIVHCLQHFTFVVRCSGKVAMHGDVVTLYKV